VTLGFVALIVRLSGTEATAAVAMGATACVVETVTVIDTPCVVAKGEAVGPLPCVVAAGAMEKSGVMDGMAVPVPVPLTARVVVALDMRVPVMDGRTVVLDATSVVLDTRVVVPVAVVVSLDTEVPLFGGVVPPVVVLAAGFPSGKGGAFG
jgi:hypothetical protein